MQPDVPVCRLSLHTPGSGILTTAEYSTIYIFGIKAMFKTLAVRVSIKGRILKLHVTHFEILSSFEYRLSN